MNKIRIFLCVFLILLLAANIVLGETASGTEKREPDIYYVPTPDDVVEIMIRLADIKKDDLVYDLGCGDGRIVIAAAAKYGCRAVGYDIDPEMVALSRKNAAKAGVEHLVTIEEADIFTLDLSQADVITLYLLPELNVRLIPQLEKLKPGARILSHDFDMAGVEPDVVAGIGRDHRVFLWTTPLKKVPVEDEGAR